MRALTVDEVDCVGGGAKTQLPEVGVEAYRTHADDYFLWSCTIGRSRDCISMGDVYSGVYDYAIRAGVYSTRDWDTRVKDNRSDYNHVTDIEAHDNHLLYEQTSGDLYVVNDDGTLRLVAQGYSGAAGEARNNPLFEGVKDKGPVPLGSYDIGSSLKDESRGANTMPLIPSSISAPNGNGLLIHAENHQTHDASTGCNILDPATRAQISQLDNATLEVVRNVPASGVYVFGR